MSQTELLGPDWTTLLKSSLDWVVYRAPFVEGRVPPDNLSPEDERFVRLRQLISQRLWQASEQISGSSVVDWHLSQTPEHTHPFKSSLGGGLTHKSVQYEISLVMGGGRVIVFVPILRDQGSHLHLVSINLRDKPGKDQLCNQVGKDISFGHSDEAIDVALIDWLIQEIPRIHAATQS